jgi:hypothetical protein
MKRFAVIRVFCKLIPEDALCIFVGKGICEEAFVYDKPNHFYIDDEVSSLSLGLGLAMTDKRRVFIFCTDTKLLSEIEVALQMSVSACKNLFLIVLSTGRYMDLDNQPSLFGQLSSPKGFLFNTGMVVHDYTNQVKDGHLEKDLKAVLPSLQGPLVALIRLPHGKKKCARLDLFDDDMIGRLNSFLNSEE